MKTLLTFKHWQLFILLFVVPLVAQLVLMAYMFSQLMARDTPLPADDPTVAFGMFSNIMLVVLVVMGIVMLLHFTWQYTLGSNLHKKLPAGVTMNLGLFRAFLIIPFVYIILLGFFMADMFSDIQSNEIPNFYWFAAIIPLHLLSMFCMFYGIYFNAKSLKAVELQKQVIANDYLAEFFLFWFFPVGVWLLQPRINKIFEAKV